ncbi:putative transposase [Candidatus Electrothrix aarhusensis]|uniref:Putative transposase n=1 Tax=Candidatus Electrothrix aarhusensis TaxID=1859131 RepID=A0A444IRQ3_9BACT|nr:putative transposase [Candidatus Electrothrix aarhusensis]
MNPVRAGIVEHPGEYQWSSYGINAQGEKSSLIKPHPLYKGLGDTKKERREGYQELFCHELDTVEIDKIRKATNGGFSLGNDRFNNEISIMLGRRVTPGKAGRPKKNQEE